MKDYGFGGPRRPLVWRILLWPVTLLSSAFSRFSDGDEIQGIGGPLGLLKLIFVSPFVWLWRSGTLLLINWSTSRSIRSFLAGMPAFVFALGITAIYIFGSLNRQPVTRMYKQLVLETRELARSDQSKYDQAELYLNRLIRLVPEEREDNQVRKAELLFDQKRYAEAADILRQLVRPGDAGNPRAHLMLGQYYLTGEFRKNQGFDRMTPQERLRFTYDAQSTSERHLEQALTATQTEVLYPAHGLLVQLYSQKKLYERAARSLQYMAERNPMVADLHYEFFTKRLNLPQAAESQAEKNHQWLAEASAKDPDNIQVWQVRTKLFLRQRKFGEALASLNQGIEAATRMEAKAILAQFQSEVLLENALAIAAEQGEAATRVQRLTLLSQAVWINPGNRRAVEQLVVLGFPLNQEDSEQWLFEAKAGAQAGSPLYYGVNMLLGLKALFANDQATANQYLNLAAGLGPGFSQVLQALTLAIDPNAKDLLTEATAAGAASPNELPSVPALFGIYMILGSRSVLEKKYDRGLDFFRKASEANPNSAEATNNLAYCMINRESATQTDFEQALILASNIIETNPNIPNFYETRGAIYLKLNEPLQAISDFEKALALGFQNRALIHKNLVVACRALGRDAEADAYQKMLDELTETNPPAVPVRESSDHNRPPTAAEQPPSDRTDGSAETETEAATSPDKAQGEAKTSDSPDGRPR